MVSIYYVFVEFIELDFDIRNLGIWVGGIWFGCKIVVFEFVDFILEEENVYEVLLNGVGFDGSIFIKMKGGKFYVLIICYMSIKMFFNYVLL